MERPDNPRYPHRCTIWRQIVDSPLEDEDITTSQDDNPLSDEGMTVEGADSGEEITENPSVSNKIVIYEGECRAYDKHTTSDRGDVITSFRGLSLPVTRNDWEQLGVVPMEGDEIRVDRGGYHEYGRVVDKNPGNFGGTHLVWRYGRN